MSFLILLSALLYDVAFFFAEYFGFLVLPSLFLIFWVLKEGQRRKYTQCMIGVGIYTDRSNHTSKQFFWQGLAWGMLVFSVHFVWLLVLLLDKVKSGKCFAIFAYAFGMTYFSLTSALWFVITAFLIKKFSRYYIPQILIFFATCYGYFYLLENYALWWLGRIEGYPFLNPLIPLINFKLFIKALMFTGILFSRGVGSYNTYNSGVISNNYAGLSAAKLDKPDYFEFIYLKPEIVSVDQNLVSYEYQIYRKLCDLKLWERRDEHKQFIIFAPESSFPFPLNTHPGVIELWSNVLPDNAHLLIGTQYKLNEKICQAVCWLNKCRINNFYVKKHCVPFVEKIPHFYKKLKPIQDVFLSRVFPEGVAQFSRAKKLRQQNYFEFNCLDSLHKNIHDKIIFIPQICSELFFVSSYKLFFDIARANSCGSKDNQQVVQSQHAYIIFFVNDSWFLNYFKKIMQDSVRLKSVLSGVPLIYIGHKELKLF
ncbi:MAG: hypothetical protein WCS92_02835 [Candidatus Babeliales bacterium]